MNSAEIEEQFPMHWNVWHNKCRELREILQNSTEEIEKVDPRGRTPLHLAVSLGHLESTRLLLQFKANVHAENAKGWSVLHEAISTGDPELVAMVLQQRDYQRAKERVEGIQTLLHKLKEATDFYVEMKWEFTSWIPLLSKVCPSDVYRVWKSGSNLRVDTTLLGFDQMSWQRGKRSFMFKEELNTAKVVEIDHDSKEAFVEELSLQAPSSSTFIPLKEHIEHRLTHPLVCTHLDTDHITFERGKSGFWGWRNDRSDTVGEYEAEVYIAQNLEFVTKTRTEHVDDKESKTANGSNNIAANALNSILGLAKSHSETSLPTDTEEGAVGISENIKMSQEAAQNPDGVSIESYFSKSTICDIGRPMELTTKIQKFKATVWQCADYPLSLQEQVTPIIDLMAISNTHFAKLKDFIALKLPKGFPIKIEIPLFHVLNAKITFGNLNGCNNNNVPFLSKADCASNDVFKVEDECFNIPEGYKMYATARDGNMSVDEDERLLEFAIQQSLVDANAVDEQVTLMEALTTSGPMPIANRPLPECPNELSSFDTQLEMAMSMSKKAQLDDAELRQQEEEELQKVLALSVLEK